MPISQHRVIAILQAAEDYKSAYEKSRELILQFTKMLQSRTSEHDDLLLMLDAQTDPKILLSDPANSAGILLIESTHFVRNFARNERNARRNAERRREDPTRVHVPRSTTPRINSISQLKQHSYLYSIPTTYNSLPKSVREQILHEIEQMHEGKESKEDMTNNMTNDMDDDPIDRALDQAIANRGSGDVTN